MTTEMTRTGRALVSRVPEVTLCFWLTDAIAVPLEVTTLVFAAPTVRRRSASTVDPVGRAGLTTGLAVTAALLRHLNYRWPLRRTMERGRTVTSSPVASLAGAVRTWGS
jgi:uncharacterized membrane-anchored protein